MSTRAWIAFASVSVLWGIPYLFIKVAVDDGMPPAFLAWVRVLLAAVVLLALAWRAGVLGSVRGKMRWIAAYAVLEISIPFPLIAAGEQGVSSSLAAILIATVPLMIALLAMRFEPSERVRGRRMVGLLIGFSGVVALVGIDVAGRTSELVGAALILVAAAGYSAGRRRSSTARCAMWTRGRSWARRWAWPPWCSPRSHSSTFPPAPHRARRSPPSWCWGCSARRWPS